MSENKGYRGYKRIGRLSGKLLFNKVTVLAVQDESYACRFIELGTDPEKIRVTGMMKYDTAAISPNVEGTDKLAAALGIGEQDKLIVAGGTGPREEEMLLNMFVLAKSQVTFSPCVRLAIVPRKPERFDEVATIIRNYGFTCIRRSQYGDDGPAATDSSAIILGDTMGELRKFYKLAAAVFVGRSLVKMGGSDMIEAAALGLPVSFGPHVFNFPQARQLVQAKVARQVEDIKELGQVLAYWLANPAVAQELGKRAREFILAQQGATRRNVEVICDVLGRTAAQRPGDIAMQKTARQ